MSEGLETSLRQASVGGQLAYIETNYFGGAGSQAAALFRDGAVVMRAAKPIDRLPAHEDHPINSALRHLGVAASRDMDEFDALGLGRFRDLESLGLDEWGDD
ncbi:hypothetical protein DMC47_25625 [Nostoc sp. 3335mG]|nr:hypothetical protein DMC47_25625 [Nostoc sp. 3335mG]